MPQTQHSILSATARAAHSKKLPPFPNNSVRQKSLTAGFALIKRIDDHFAHWALRDFIVVVVHPLDMERWSIFVRFAAFSDIFLEITRIYRFLDRKSVV